jgi:hypothetical protein
VQLKALRLNAKLLQHIPQQGDTPQCLVVPLNVMTITRVAATN